MKNLLKPHSDTIRQIAIDETDPTTVSRFAPICRGPIIALIILIAVGTIGGILGLLRASLLLFAPSTYKNSNG